MESLTLFRLLVVLGIFASACSQIMLKRSAEEKHSSWLTSLLNRRVILAYAIFFASLFINITAMSKGMNLKELPILESLGYIFVPLLSYYVLKEKLNRRVLLSMLFIIIGIYIFYL